MIDTNEYGVKLNTKPTKVKIPQAPIKDARTLTPSGNDMVGSHAAHVGSLQLEPDFGNVSSVINTYRRISQFPDVSKAIDFIVNDAVVVNTNNSPVELEINGEVGDETKKVLIDSFKKVVRKCNLRSSIYDLFRRWYVDSVQYFYIEGDKDNGIHRIVNLDPLKIREHVIRKNGVTKRFYIYNNGSRNIFGSNNSSSNTNNSGSNGSGGLNTDNGYGSDGNVKQYANGISYRPQVGDLNPDNDDVLILSADSVIKSDSGMTDSINGVVLGYLHKSVRCAISLRHLEDSSVIYRVVRGPERRIFNVEMPHGTTTATAQKRLEQTMAKFSKRTAYNANTGEVIHSNGNESVVSMMDDFYFSKTPDGKGTTVETLPGGQNLGVINDIVYFRENLYRSLDVPLSRLEPEQGFSLGKTTEISRDEVNFNRHIQRLRVLFSDSFIEMLKIELLLTKKMDIDEWNNIKTSLGVTFLANSYFDELKQRELMDDRLNTLRGLQPEWVGTLFSVEHIKRKILNYSSQEIQEMDEQIKKEEASGELEKFRSGLSAVSYDKYGDVEQPSAPKPEDFGKEYEQSIQRQNKKIENPNPAPRVPNRSVGRVTNYKRVTKDKQSDTGVQRGNNDE